MNNIGHMQYPTGMAVRRFLLLLGISILSVPVALAEPETEMKRAIAKCAAVADSVLRAQCYDELARSIGLDAPKVAASSKGKWRLSEKSSPIDDSKTVVGILDADAAVPVGPYKRSQPKLILRCSENVTSAYLVYNVFLGSDEMEVTTRTDSDRALTWNWNISNDHNAVGLWEGGTAIPFIKTMLGKERLVVRLTPYSESPVTVSFTLNGLDSVVASVGDTCGWVLQPQR